VENLCLQCGLCCNGVLFADVRRERGDTSPLFKKFGVRVAQPCPAFNSSDCKCALYLDRPARCRKFECKQLLGVAAGKISDASALKKIRAAKKLAAQITALLSQFETNLVWPDCEKLPLSQRFQAVQRAAERGQVAPEHFDALADLQLAVHQLNATLAQDFYA
jgi:Fe-S-cluster containining protein